MSLVRVTAPDPILDLADVKTHLHVEHDEHDGYIADLIAAATDCVDGADGGLGRALGAQAWDWKVDACDFPPASMPCREVELILPLQPVISVDEITYLDGNGAEQTWAAFALLGAGSRTARGRIIPAWNTSWPDVRWQAEAVTVSFTAGYQVESGESPDVMVEDVPWKVKAAIKLIIGDLYAQRETVVNGAVSAEAKTALRVQDILDSIRVFT